MSKLLVKVYMWYTFRRYCQTIPQWGCANLHIQKQYSLLFIPLLATVCSLAQAGKILYLLTAVRSSITFLFVRSSSLYPQLSPTYPHMNHYNAPNMYVNQGILSTTCLLVCFMIRIFSKPLNHVKYHSLSSRPQIVSPHRQWIRFLVRCRSTQNKDYIPQPSLQRGAAPSLMRYEPTVAASGSCLQRQGVPVLFLPALKCWHSGGGHLGPWGCGMAQP